MQGDEAAQAALEAAQHKLAQIDHLGPAVRSGPIRCGKLAEAAACLVFASNCSFLGVRLTRGIPRCSRARARAPRTAFLSRRSCSRIPSNFTSTAPALTGRRRPGPGKHRVDETRQIFAGSDRSRVSESRRFKLLMVRHGQKECPVVFAGDVGGLKAARIEVLDDPLDPGGAAGT